MASSLTKAKLKLDALINRRDTECKQLRLYTATYRATATTLGTEVTKKSPKVKTTIKKLDGVVPKMQASVKKIGKLETSIDQLVSMLKKAGVKGVVGVNIAQLKTINLDSAEADEL